MNSFLNKLYDALLVLLMTALLATAVCVASVLVGCVSTGPGSVKAGNFCPAPDKSQLT